MKKLSLRTAGALALAVLTLAATRPARAWDPPDGPAADQVTPPATPTTLLPKAHGYIIQNGITILNNDGYWAAAQQLRQWQQELLNGVRYADKYEGSQSVDLQICELFGVSCQTLDSGIDNVSWPYGADNHYFNPDTGQGLQAGWLATTAYWGPIVSFLFQVDFTAGLVFLAVDVQPPLASVYPSALTWMQTEFTNAQNAYLGTNLPPSISGRSGMALAMFYLGWASHFMQDQAVVHHTFDQPRMHHAEYEGWADADTSVNPPAWDRAFTAPPDPTGITGMYSVPSSPFCTAGSAPCFAAYANGQVHNSSVLSAIDAANGQDTSSVLSAIPMIEALQAGLYRYFLASVGSAPVQLSAELPAIKTTYF